jgi:hypothetical protein
MADFETVEVTTDFLIIGGGMAACGAAVEAAHWAKKHNLKVTVRPWTGVALLPWGFQPLTSMSG